MKNRKKRRVMLLLILILSITIGFALLSTTLKINGTAGIKGNTWNIHWDDTSVNVTTGSVDAEDPVVSTVTSSKDTVSFEVEFEVPGDFYEFEIDAINEGSVDGALELAQNWITYKSNNVETTLPEYMDFKVTYDDDTKPASGDILTHGTSKTYKVRVEFKSNVEELPENPEPIIIEVNLPYVQYKDPSVSPKNFNDDSWDTIQDAIQNDDTDVYSIGDTKEIEMDLNEDGVSETYHLRIVNMSTPTECSGSDFSQSACGFVVELVEGLPDQNYNPSRENCGVSGNCSTGGWSISQLHNYLNNEFYNALPSGLKNIIIPTKVVSGHNSVDSNNFTSIHSIYIISTKELYNYNLRYDSAATTTRQLDYYHDLGVNYNPNVEGAKKELDYWTRSYPYNSTGIYYIQTSGWTDIRGADQSVAAYPLFRIG